MNRIRILFSKGTLLNRLLRKYAVIMIGVTMTATIIFSVHTWNQNQKQAENMTSDAVQSTSRMLNDKTTLSRIIKTNSSVIPKNRKCHYLLNKTHRSVFDVCI